MNLLSLPINTQKATALLKAMSNEKRLQILCLLADGEKSVSALEKVVDLSQSALSQHLARLRQDDLVTTRRSAQTIYYSLQDDRAIRILRTLHDIYCPGESARAANHPNCGEVAA
ncbi:metalloregulator ArsR/SmtB family transcription factor [Inquilinus sp. CAU 1745]|uniref:ArsR/SmtB family transcription factor n=1 Tax=Inquilinus sp. CAU 1745 TaxID=3140369 RepID=UPI00325B1C84